MAENIRYDLIEPLRKEYSDGGHPDVGDLTSPELEIVLFGEPIPPIRVPNPLARIIRALPLEVPRRLLSLIL